MRWISSSAFVDVVVIQKSCTQLLEQQKMWVSWSQIISYPLIPTHCYQCQSHYYFPGYSIRLIIIIYRPYECIFNLQFCHFPNKSSSNLQFTWEKEAEIDEEDAILLKKKENSNNIYLVKIHVAPALFPPN